ncbi:hypothetical protein [Flavobacterium eburneipallidum]|uniref:hypothetical protein n=1 Tax=Flavobacterium eburneipallidum TaxID=3003263 RepID=UPI0024824797|nr:hypothetical protein [Flavobacterium eburneipallidum]
MEKVNILYRPEVESYLNELIFVLFKENYFSYLENSILYKDKIIDFIENDIATFPSKKTPSALKNFGSKYIFYKSNQRTTWYVFFESKKNNYLITNIINSHSEESKWL